MSYESESSEETRNNFVSQKIEKIKFEGLIKKVIPEPRKLRRNGKATAEIQFYLVAGGIMQGNGIIRVQKHRPLEELGPGQGLPYRSWASKEAVSWERSLTQDRTKEEYLTSSLLLPCNLLPVCPTGQTYLEIQFLVIQSRAREGWDLDLRANKQMASTLVDSKGKRKFLLPQLGLTRQFPCKFVLV